MTKNNYWYKIKNILRICLVKYNIYSPSRARYQYSVVTKLPVEYNKNDMAKEESWRENIIIVKLRQCNKYIS